MNKDKLKLIARSIVNFAIKWTPIAWRRMQPALRMIAAALAWLAVTTVWLVYQMGYYLTRIVVTCIVWLFVLCVWIAQNSWRLFRRDKAVMAVGIGWGFFICAIVFFSYVIFYGPVESPFRESSLAKVEYEQADEPTVIEAPEEADVDVDTDPTPTVINTACGEACVSAIRTSRSKLRKIEENEVKYVLTQYNTYVKSSTWRNRARACHEKYWKYFEQAEGMTLYPAEFIAGKALIEGAGCRFVPATNGDGGIGPMQITHPSRGHIVQTGRMLGVTTDQVAYKSNYLHNVLLGTIMFSDFEDMFGSRGVGLLAYNRGPGNVRKDMRRANLSSYTHRVLSDFRGGIPQKAGIGGRPRVYTDKVLAGMVIMDRVAKGLPLTPLTTLSLKDIPGADPSQDGSGR